MSELDSNEMAQLARREQVRTALTKATSLIDEADTLERLAGLTDSIIPSLADHNDGTATPTKTQDDASGSERSSAPYLHSYATPSPSSRSRSATPV